MGNLSLWIVFFGGLVSFLSPCVLSLVPAYIGFISDDLGETGKGNRWFVIQRTLLFILGFSFIFVLMGASVGAAGSLLVRYRPILMRISGLFIMIFGLRSLGILKIPFLDRDLRMRAPRVIHHGFDAFFMGVAFAAGWTPCVGNVLASVLLYVGTTTKPLEGIFYLVVYSMGLGIPFLMTALAVDRGHRFFQRYEKALAVVSKLGGILLVLLGGLIFLNRLTAFSQYFNFFNIQI